MGVSKNYGTPKSSILMGFSIINHPFWGTPIFGNIHIYIYLFQESYTYVILYMWTRRSESNSISQSLSPANDPKEGLPSCA